MREMIGNLEVRYVDSTMARVVLGWNPRSSEGAVTATGQSLIDPGCRSAPPGADLGT